MDAPKKNPWPNIVLYVVATKIVTSLITVPVWMLAMTIPLPEHWLVNVVMGPVILLFPVWIGATLARRMINEAGDNNKFLVRSTITYTLLNALLIINDSGIDGLLSVWGLIPLMGMTIVFAYVTQKNFLKAKAPST